MRILGGNIISGGVVIEGGIPRSVNPFANIHHVRSGGSIQAAINAAGTYDIIAVAPGDYAAISVPRTKTGLSIIGLGNPQSVFIGDAGDAQAVLNDADKVVFENLWLEDATVGLLNRGKNVRF